MWFNKQVTVNNGLEYGNEIIVNVKISMAAILFRTILQTFWNNWYFNYDESILSSSFI